MATTASRDDSATPLLAAGDGKAPAEYNSTAAAKKNKIDGKMSTVNNNNNNNTIYDDDDENENGDGSRSKIRPPSKTQVSVADVATEIQLDSSVDMFLTILQQTTFLEPDPKRCFLPNARIALSGEGKFYIVIMAFLIPTLISILQLVFQPPAAPRIYLDSCANLTEQGQPFSMEFCIMCNENRTYVSSQHIPLPPGAKPLRLAAIISAISFGVISGIVYTRLSFQEYLALRLLAYGVLIQSEAANVAQLKPVIFMIVGALFVGSLVGASLLYTSESYHDIPLHYAHTNYTEDPYYNTPSAIMLRSVCVGVVAVFDEAENHSITTDSLSFIQIMQTVITSILPFILVVLKIYTAVAATFSVVALEDLTKNAAYAARMFEYMKMGTMVAESDMMNAIQAFSKTQRPEARTIPNLLRRLIVLDFDLTKPPPALFGITWGSRFTYDKSRLAQILKLVTKKDYQEHEIQKQRFLVGTDRSEEAVALANGLCCEQQYLREIFTNLAQRKLLHEYHHSRLVDKDGYELYTIEGPASKYGDADGDDAEDDKEY